MKISFHTFKSFIKKRTIKYLSFKQMDGVTAIFRQKLKLRTSNERVDGLGLSGRLGKRAAFRKGRCVQPKWLKLPQRKHINLVRTINSNNLQDLGMVPLDTFEERSFGLRFIPRQDTASKWNKGRNINWNSKHKNFLWESNPVHRRI